jgi:hypothetical protein
MKNIILILLLIPTIVFACDDDNGYQLAEEARTSRITNELRQQRNDANYNAYINELNQDRQIRQERNNAYQTQMILLDGQFVRK